jgi:hypothetical protein
MCQQYYSHPVRAIVWVPTGPLCLPEKSVTSKHLPTVLLPVVLANKSIVYCPPRIYQHCPVSQLSGFHYKAQSMSTAICFACGFSTLKLSLCFTIMQMKWYSAGIKRLKCCRAKLNIPSHTSTIFAHVLSEAPLMTRYTVSTEEKSCVFNRISDMDILVPIVCLKYNLLIQLSIFGHYPLSCFLI